MQQVNEVQLDLIGKYVEIYEKYNSGYKTLTPVEKQHLVEQAKLIKDELDFVMIGLQLRDALSQLSSDIVVPKSNIII